MAVRSPQVSFEGNIRMRPFLTDCGGVGETALLRSFVVVTRTVRFCLYTFVFIGQDDSDDCLSPEEDAVQEDTDEEVKEVLEEEPEEDSCIAPQLSSRLLLPQEDGAVLLLLLLGPPDNDVSEVEKIDENPLDVIDCVEPFESVTEAIPQARVRWILLCVNVHFLQMVEQPGAAVKLAATITPVANSVQPSITRPAEPFATEKVMRCRTGRYRKADRFRLR
uniref:Uncharacterized protein n=1 Tax=Anopheles culicifacies TaxID=139723 RepID=A0A182MKV4_9DIPT